MNKPLFQLVEMQIKEFFREPEILFWSFFFPIAIAGVLGVAFVNRGESVNTVAVIATQTNDAPIPSLQSVLEDTSGLRLVSMSLEEAELAMKRGKIALYVAKDSVNKGWNAYFDPLNSEANLAFLSLKNSLLEKNQTPILQASHITTPGSRYIDFLIPGLLALGIMNSCMWGIGWALVESRIKKLMRRMVATPMKRSTYLFSYISTRTFLAFIEALTVFLFAYFVFGVSIQGNIIAVLLTFLSGVAAFAGIAVLISSRAKNTQVGNGLLNAVVLPMTILSGVFFSYQNFPDWAVSIVQYLPLSMLADSMRAVFIEAATLADIAGKLLLLTLVGVLCFLAGLRIYKWY